ncbi:hypothetical protein NA57DRAFT_81791 [Rhizodiscina lignyota]|uniref:Uncharacterized protein n=1 Tax=Rhizodiscina lignyota TaxID=1504668 RepID=A0A9P4I185_9PEZI|nr:hypothetical protein NA57DRAFT_81791 [Rhizodiscina lignyota]
MSHNSTFSNAALTCNFTSVGEVFTTANATNQSVTGIVQKCPDVCALTWGVGNPDLSGIGVLIAYISQTVLTLLFGPILLSGVIIAKRLLRPDDEFKTTCDLQSQFHAISGLFSLPVTVAAIVRVHQGATLFELSFMQSLLLTQILGSLSDFSTMTGVLGTMTGLKECARGKKKFVEITKGDEWAGRGVKRLLLLLTQITLYSVFLTPFSISEDSLTSYKEYFKACPKYSSLSPVLIFSSDADSPFWNYLITICLVLVGALFIGYGACWLIVLDPLIAIAISLGLCGGVVFYTINMYKKRLLLRTLVGPQDQDNEWGFGQVVPFFLWLPLLVRSFEIPVKACMSLDPEDSRDNSSSVEEGLAADSATIGRSSLAAGGREVDSSSVRYRRRSI